MNSYLKSFLFFSCLIFLQAQVPLTLDQTLGQEVYIVNPNLPGDNMVFTIENVAGAYLQIAPYTGADNQIFIVTLVEGYYWIQSKSSGNYLTVQGTTFVTQEPQSTDVFTYINQQFNVLQRLTQNFCFRSRSNGNFLQFDASFDYSAGNWVTLSPYIVQALPTFGDPQNWNFYLA